MIGSGVIAWMGTTVSFFLTGLAAFFLLIS